MIRTLFFGLILTLFVASASQAKDLSSRLGVGYRNSLALDLPAIAANYYPNSEFGLIGALGVDTADQNSRFAFTGGVRKNIFMEDNLNFFIGGNLSVISQEINNSTDSGFELQALVGTEFFLAGLENLGFDFETGVAVNNVNKVRFRTLGNSFLQAGVFFYF